VNSTMSHTTSYIDEGLRQHLLAKKPKTLNRYDQFIDLNKHISSLKLVLMFFGLYNIGKPYDTVLKGTDEYYETTNHVLLILGHRFKLWVHDHAYSNFFALLAALCVIAYLLYKL
jgi:hypothetical protein